MVIAHKSSYCGGSRRNGAPARLLQGARCIPALVLLAVIAACDSTPTAPTGGAALWPRSIGDAWVYRVTFVDETGAERMPARDETVRVLRDTVVRGTRWSVVDGHPLVVAGSIVGRQFLSDRPKGVWHATTLTLDPFLGVEPGGLAFKYPAAVGDLYLGAGSTMQVEATDATVSVPAGQFRCVRYAAVLVRAPG